MLVPLDGQFRRPDGQALPDVPAPPLPAPDPAAALRAQNDAAGHHPDARTACPNWQGHPLDVRWAIDVLHPRAQRPKTLGE
jgi:hypothetical protein